MEKIILRYDNLQIPQTFVSSVELFKLSSETQLESDKQMMEWIDFCLIARQNNEDIFELAPYLNEYKNTIVVENEL